jgi:hypothetical protein
MKVESIKEQQLYRSEGEGARREKERIAGEDDQSGREILRRAR